jgi:hypothetical protein
MPTVAVDETARARDAVRADAVGALVDDWLDDAAAADKAAWTAAPR